MITKGCRSGAAASSAVFSANGHCCSAARPAVTATATSTTLSAISSKIAAATYTTITVTGTATRTAPASQRTMPR